MMKTLRLSLLLTTFLAVPAISQAAFINFGAGVTQIVPGPTTYSFVFGTPIPPALYSYATAVAEVTLTPGSTGEATLEVSAVHPTYLSGYGMDGAVATNLGVDLGSTPCVALRDPVTCQFALVSNTFAPTFYDGLQALLTFQVTGDGAIVNWTGSVTLENSPPANAPEPTVLALLATGMVVASRARRRRR
jgi:hypothetical protein